jgi:hypothetical protein
MTGPAEATGACKQCNPHEVYSHTRGGWTAWTFWTRWPLARPSSPVGLAECKQRRSAEVFVSAERQGSFGVWVSLFVTQMPSNTSPVMYKWPELFR